MLMVLSSLLVLMGDWRILRESSLVMCVLIGYAMLVNGDPGTKGTIGKSLGLSLVALAFVQLWRLPAAHPALWRWWGVVLIAGSLQILTSWWSKSASVSVLGMILAMLGIGVGIVEFWYFSKPHLEQQRMAARGKQ